MSQGDSSPVAAEGERARAIDARVVKLVPTKSRRAVWVVRWMDVDVMGEYDREADADIGCLAFNRNLASALRAPQPSGEEIRGCPCLHIAPCHYACTCAQPFMSGGCRRCAAYGSLEQQRATAVHLARLIDAAPESPEAVARVERIRTFHRQSPSLNWCSLCHEDWPCDAVWLLARLTPPTGTAAGNAGETRTKESKPC